MMMEHRRLALVLLAPACGGLAAAFLASIGFPGSLGRVLASQALLLGMVVGAAAFARAAPLRERLGLLPSRLGTAEVLLCAVGLLCLSNAGFQILQALDLLGRGSLGRIDHMIAQGRSEDPWLVLLALGISAGLAEELVFRGFVQRMIAERWGPLPGILAAAGAFALMHWDPVHSPVAAVMGVYLGFVAALAGSVWPAMLCHVANNLVGVGLGLAGFQIPQTSKAVAIPLLLLASLLCLGSVMRRHGLAPPAPDTTAAPALDSSEPPIL